MAVTFSNYVCDNELVKKRIAYWATARCLLTKFYMGWGYNSRNCYTWQLKTEIFRNDRNFLKAIAMHAAEIYV